MDLVSQFLRINRLFLFQLLYKLVGLIVEGSQAGVHDQVVNQILQVEFDIFSCELLEDPVSCEDDGNRCLEDQCIDTESEPFPRI